jgi:hypothetical protein
MSTVLTRRKALVGRPREIADFAGANDNGVGTRSHKEKSDAQLGPALHQR